MECNTVRLFYPPSFTTRRKMERRIEKFLSANNHHERTNEQTNERTNDDSQDLTLYLVICIVVRVLWWNSAAIEQFRGRGRKGRKGRFVPSSGATVLGRSRPTKGWILNDRTQPGPSFSGRPLLLLAFSFLRSLPLSSPLSLSPALRFLAAAERATLFYRVDEIAQSRQYAPLHPLS